MNPHITLALSACLALVAAPAFAADLTVPTVVDDPPGMQEVLDANVTYQNYRGIVDKLDVEIAANRLGSNHPRTIRMKQVRAVYGRKLEEIRAEIRAALVARQREDRDRVVSALIANDRLNGEGFGLTVTKAPSPAAGEAKLPRGAGLVVRAVQPGSAADRAGVMAGDLLHRLDGQLLVNGEQFEVLAGALEAGRAVTIELIRDGSRLERPVTVQEDEPTPASRPALGE